MLNRIVISEKNQIVTLKVVDELRHVDVKPALHSLEKNAALNNSQKVSLDLNNLQVISQETQELLGLIVRHVRLKNIPITFPQVHSLIPEYCLQFQKEDLNFQKNINKYKTLLLSSQNIFQDFQNHSFHLMKTGCLIRAKIMTQFQNKVMMNMALIMVLRKIK